MAEFLPLIDGFIGALALIVNGIIINTLQLLTYIIVRPISIRLFRRLQFPLVQFFWAPIVAWAERCSTLHLYGDTDVMRFLAMEKSVLVSNHLIGADWLFLWAGADRVGALPHCKAMLKASLRFVPFLGWSWLCADYPFLTRCWNQDLPILKACFKGLIESESPFKLTIFVEGTRLTPSKLKESQDYAKQHNLPHLNNLLLPRSRGFIAALTALQTCVDSVFDLTCAARVGNTPTLRSILLGERNEIHIIVERFSLRDVPIHDALETNEWLLRRWSNKDKYLEIFKKDNSFAKVKPKLNLPKSKSTQRLYRITQFIFFMIVAYLTFLAKGI